MGNARKKEKQVAQKSAGVKRGRPAKSSSSEPTPRPPSSRVGCASHKVLTAAPESFENDSQDEVEAERDRILQAAEDMFGVPKEEIAAAAGDFMVSDDDKPLSIESGTSSDEAREDSEEEDEPGIYTQFLVTMCLWLWWAAEIELEFLIPIDGATETKLVKSDLEWGNFCYMVAGELGIKRDDLNLAYKFSTAVQKEMPKLLTKPIHFSALWDDAWKEITQAQKKKSKKVLRVSIIDRNAGTKKPKGSDNKGIPVRSGSRWQDM
jgi:hypothetical protein